MQLDSMDQTDGLRKVLAAFQAKAGRCPASWKEIEPVLRALRVNVDPGGTPTRSVRQLLMFCGLLIATSSSIKNQKCLQVKPVSETRRHDRAANHYDQCR